MGVIKTAYEYRLPRAKWLVDNGHVSLNGAGPGCYDVKSQYSPGKVYHVKVRVDEGLGWVLETSCTCPDWLEMFFAINEYPMNSGISQINYNPACKHVLACLLERGDISG